MKKHQRKAYEEMLFRATYYSWSARKNQTLGGNDPVSGRPRQALAGDFREEGREAYKAMAHLWLKKAKKYREAL